VAQDSHARNGRSAATSVDRRADDAECLGVADGHFAAVVNTASATLPIAWSSCPGHDACGRPCTGISGTTTRADEQGQAWSSASAPARAEQRKPKKPAVRGLTRPAVYLCNARLLRYISQGCDNSPHVA
jgi:hypothetical protein